MSSFVGKLQLLLPMLVYGIIDLVFNVSGSSILYVARSKMRSSACQSAGGKVRLMVELMSGLVVVSVMMLLCMVRVVVLMLKLGHLHCKSLMGLATIQHGRMLSLVALAVHAVCVGDRIRN